MLGNPALRRLLFLKARGSVRRQVRRVRTLRGLVLTLFGLFLFGMWIFAVVGRALLGGREADPDPEQMRSLVRLGGLFFCLLNGFGALSHRGLFLPKEEIERLFSAPVRRADLVRYRLQTNLLRSSIGALFIGAVLMMRIPRPLFGFCAVFAGLAMLPVFGQALSILAGSLEKRFDRFLAVPRVVAFAVSIAGVIWLTLAFTVGEGDPDPRNWMGEVALPSSLPELLAQPWLAAVLAPFEPWARAATAQTWSQFLPWIAVCAVAWVMGYELTARIPVDFRELSLETSANVAERIRRVRRVGGGASAAKLSDRAAGLRVPWFFGRGPAGAVAWRKASGILRKARGTLWVSLGVLALLVLLVVATTRSIDEPGHARNPVLVRRPALRLPRGPLAHGGHQGLAAVVVAPVPRDARSPGDAGERRAARRHLPPGLDPARLAPLDPRDRRDLALGRAGVGRARQRRLPVCAGAHGPRFGGRPAEHGARGGNVLPAHCAARRRRGGRGLGRGASVLRRVPRSRDVGGSCGSRGLRRGLVRAGGGGRGADRSGGDGAEALRSG
jgi:hypothetical protein